MVLHKTQSFSTPRSFVYMQGLATRLLLRFMQDMQVRPDYVPETNTDAIPNNIAGEYYNIGVLEVLQMLRYDGPDERDHIYRMAKLINSFPVLFLGLSALLQNYTIERRNPIPVDMQHIDLLFNMSKEKNDIDIANLMRNVRCFREFAKRFWFDSGNNVSAAPT